MTVQRVTHLKPGEAVVGMEISIERSRNRLLCGRIVAIQERPYHQRRLARRCTIRLHRSRTVYEYEDRLLFAAGEPTPGELEDGPNPDDEADKIEGQGLLAAEIN